MNPIVICLIILSLTTSCYAGPIEEKCSNATDSNADYRRCVQQETAVRSAPMAEQGIVKACNPKSCVYRLKFDAKADSYVGAGYSVAYRPAENGRNLVVIDSKGRSSIFFQCGTCNFLEYEKGPLKDVDVKYDGKDAFIMTINLKQ